MSGESGECFQSMNVAKVRRMLSRLHKQVATGRQRVEMTHRGCSEGCVIISKAELEAMEQALEFLAESTEYKAMCQQLSELAAATCDGYAITPR